MTETCDRERELVVKIHLVTELAARFGPIFPMRVSKVPLSEHGLHDATRDPETIIGWWRRWPGAVPALATGEGSDVVAVDLDIRKNGVDGRDALEALAGPFHPEAPTDHTPSGGFHILFRQPDRPVRSWTIAPGLEVKGNLGAIMLPPGPGRFWDPHLGPDMPLPPMPEWMIPREPEAPRSTRGPAPTQRLSRYAQAALDDAIDSLVRAPAGQQHVILNREAFGIGTLVAGGVIPAAEALEALTWAAQQMSSYDRKRPWRPRELERQIRAAFLDGQAYPRSEPNG